MIHFTKLNCCSFIMLSSFLCAGVESDVARAVLPSENSVYLSQAPTRFQQTYDCGESAITIREVGSDRYIYQAINPRGQTLTLTNGTSHAGRNFSSIYAFHREDGTEFVLEDFGGGSAALSIANYPDSSMNYDCTTDGNP